MDTVTAALLGFLTLLVALWIRARQRHLQYFKRIGINGPEPNFFFGNLLEIGKKGSSEVQLEWTRKYGDTFGYFMGAVPILQTVDLEFLKMVQLKEASKFINRSLFLKGGGTPLPEIEKTLISIEGDKWKRTRSLLTPTFSTGKLKQIIYLMNNCIDVFLSKLEAMKTKSVNPYEHYNRLTLDNILRTAFGVVTNVQTDAESGLYQDTKTLEENYPTDFFVLLMLSFPLVSNLLFIIKFFRETLKGLFGGPSLMTLVQTTRKIIQERKTNPQAGRKDLLQLMLDARSEKPVTDMMDLSATYGLDSKEDSKTSSTETSADKLDDDEIIGNGIVFIGAGEETTSLLLTYATYLLASYPNVQDKLRRELRDNLNEKEKMDYTSLTKLPYMDQVIKEVLRLYPPTITFVMRVALEDFEFKGKRYPKGLIIQVPLYALHRNPNYWKNPLDFDPDRFGPERKSEIPAMAYQPFGEGPRNCIGSRFAMMFAKLTLANVLLKYNIEHAHPEAAPKEISINNKLFVIHPKPFEVKFMPLSKEK